jgi:hypothetical protein
MVRKLTSQFRHFYVDNKKDRIQIDVDKKKHLSRVETLSAFVGDLKEFVSLRCSEPGER